MAGILLTRSGAEGPAPSFAQTFNVAPAAGRLAEEVSVCDLSPGESLVLKPRYCEAILNAVSAGGSNLFWEGPYVRVRPRYNTLANDQQRRLDMRRFDDAAVISRPDGTQFTLRAGSPLVSADPYYEFDAINCPAIVPPFDCTVSLVTELAGVWCFDAYILRGGLVRESGRRLYPHTRNMRTTGVSAPIRTVQVPMGTVEVVVQGFINYGLFLDRDNNGRSTADGVTTLQVSSNTGWGAELFSRFAIGNSTQVRMQGNAAGVNASINPSITFWCEL